jgi:hypothetical protein
MKLGLIGLPRSGKTTVFNALTKADIAVAGYTQAISEANVAVVDVADERVDRLSSMYNPKKTTCATIEIVDFPAVVESSEKSAALSADQMRQIKTCDAMAVVVRNFKSDIEGDPVPLETIHEIDEEMVLADMVVAETRLERIVNGNKKGLKSVESQIEERALQKVLEGLNGQIAVRDIDLNDSEKKAIKGFQFLTQKPVLVIVNSDESVFGKSSETCSMIDKIHPTVEFAGTFEMELSRLSDPDETALFMQDMGIESSARDRLSRLAYDILGLISFFTVGEDEVRAWNIVRGATAVEAAGAIHSDLSRGFIRAECFTCDDLLTLGSEKAVKENGKLRLEGKEYVVKDGDILSIRFNV